MPAAWASSKSARRTNTRSTYAKFLRRYAAMEALANADGVELTALSLEEQDRFWDAVKRAERVGQGSREWCVVRGSWEA